jgi:uncharacterized integral membrane protein
MKTLRTLLICLLFVAAVFISSANVHVVELVYLPGIGVESTWSPRSISIPLFVVVLGALIVGALLGSAGALFEQARLRLGLRQARKSVEKAEGDAEELRANAATAADEIAQLKRELELSRARREPPPPIALPEPGNKS